MPGILVMDTSRMWWGKEIIEELSELHKTKELRGEGPNNSSTVSIFSNSWNYY